MPTSTEPFDEDFDTFDRSFWYVSDFVMSEEWIHNTWAADHVRAGDGVLTLALSTQDRDGKPFTGAEVQTVNRYAYGRYEFSLQASGEAGVDTGFFTYTGPYFGDVWNEIDFEFLGKDPTKVHVGYHYDGRSVVSWVDLPFDASEDMHTYAFEWEPDEIRWYADGALIFAVDADDVSVPIPNLPSKLYMNVWTGIEGWLGTPTFDDATSSSFSAVSFAPYIYPDYDVTLTLMDGETDRNVAVLTDGMVVEVDASDPIFTIVAKAGGAGIGSVTFKLTGDATHTKTESWAPYALFGDHAGDHFTGNLGVGSYTLKLIGHSERNGAGDRLFREKIDFEVRAAASASANPDPVHCAMGEEPLETVGSRPAPQPRPAIGTAHGRDKEAHSEEAADLRVFLVHAERNEVLTELVGDTRLDFDALGTRELGVIVKASAAVKSIAFDLDGALSVERTEDWEPYSLFGDHAGDVYGRTFEEGDYILSISAYARAGGGGERLAMLDFDLAFI
ncbi:family 16 glycosylhydrolase [Acuticoccus sp.]|uniref:family 16 glycosylhydrolase n=1 Tax=Acuticoccus sp. TaxID=1904378 RepID=UPI003B5178AE